MWIALVIDDIARVSALPEYTHVAFSVSDSDYPAICRRIRETGIEIWQDNWTEGDSFYFVDPNGHKFEIHSSDLAARLRSAREAPWEGLAFFDEAMRCGAGSHAMDIPEEVPVKSFSIAAYIARIESGRGQFLIIKRRTSYLPNSWQMISGRIEKGEKAWEAPVTC